MTIQEFKAHGFKADELYKYKDKVRACITVDFEEQLIGLAFPELADKENEYGVYYVRCENAELITETEQPTPAITKTVAKWFNDIPDKDIRKKALANLRDDGDYNPVDSLKNALSTGFSWSATSEGYHFWLTYFNTLK